MAFLSSLFGGNKAGRDAGAASYYGADTANKLYDQGQTAALNQYKTNYYDPYTRTGDQAIDLYSDALGLGGEGGYTRATDSFRKSPGYDFTFDQGVQAIDRSASKGGTFGSGNAAMALTEYGQGLADQEYDDWLKSLSGLGETGLLAAEGQTKRQGNLADINMWRSGGAAKAYTDAADTAAEGIMSDAEADSQGSSNLWSAILGGGNLLRKWYQYK